MQITAFDLAQRFVGIREAPGTKDHPLILAMLKLDGEWPEHDEVPWCSAFINFVAWLLRLPRSKSLAARSWLEVGVPVPLHKAAPGFDVVVLRRGSGVQPGPEVTSGAPGHVGLFAGYDPEQNRVSLLGGNQSNTVSIQTFPASQVLGVRRLNGA